ncbi:hypothetical protein KMP13_08700 [Epibacterium ulvae]|uniref:hypothetical protein n=1 Tax=Epibacterium ulvae TaxID=1156985 RepID=UPI001BFC17F9|nr:hypothetical protein [Epibacterium ulvae]MBT8153975.1 hypothetical protein [Epibacterium ulvae]
MIEVSFIMPLILSLPLIWWGVPGWIHFQRRRAGRETPFGLVLYYHISATITLFGFALGGLQGTVVVLFPPILPILAISTVISEPRLTFILVFLVTVSALCTTAALVALRKTAHTIRPTARIWMIAPAALVGILLAFMLFDLRIAYVLRQGASQQNLEVTHHHSLFHSLRDFDEPFRRFHASAKGECWIYYWSYVERNFYRYIATSNTPECSG